jgi:very-short-patch-repair endonuclease/predicted transcriptional regulator of viral defense system
LTVTWTVGSEFALSVGAGRGIDGIERAMLSLAKRQHGVVTRAQLARLGLSADSVDNRVRSGRLRLVQRGVYALGPLGQALEAEMAAVLACGEAGVLSHRSAAVLWGLLPHPAKPSPVDVTVVGKDRGHRPGIRVHRVKSLARDEVTKLDGILVTTVARTILDLAASGPARELEQAIAQADRRHPSARRKLVLLLARYPGRSGSPAVRTLLASRGRAAFTRSEAEERLLALIRRAQLPEPELNVKLGDYEVDFLWPAQRVIVEVDGYAYHSGRHEFERDRAKDAALAANGFLVVRITWRQLVHEAEAVVARIAATLTLRGPPAADAGAPGAGR